MSELILTVNKLGETKPISQIPTKQLLKFRHYYYWALNVSYDKDNMRYCDFCRTVHIRKAIEPDYEEFSKYKEIISQELAKREHVLNNKESFTIRKLNAIKCKGTRNKNKK